MAEDFSFFTGGEFAHFGSLLVAFESGGLYVITSYSIHYTKLYEVGIVEIDDDVEIGSATCIDRAALGVTRIHSYNFV